VTGNFTFTYVVILISIAFQGPYRGGSSRRSFKQIPHPSSVIHVWSGYSFSSEASVTGAQHTHPSANPGQMKIRGQRVETLFCRRRQGSLTWKRARYK
jgi:hypothetical protein